MAVGDTGLTNLVLSGDLTVGGELAVTGDLTIEGAGLVTVTETFALADFTDNTDATGTAEFSVDIPVGAYFLCTQVTNIVGFAGDTSAVMTIGDGTDEDRYMTGTPSVFATAAGTVDFGVPSGAPYHGVAKTPTLIITTDSDFSSVTAGSVTVALSYIL